MSLTTLPPTRSSWISSIGYQRGYLAVFTKKEGGKEPWAWLFAGVPSTLPGLITAGRVTAKEDGTLSVGAAVHRLARSKEYVRQKIEGEEKVRELKRIMEKGDIL